MSSTANKKLKRKITDDKENALNTSGSGETATAAPLDTEPAATNSPKVNGKAEKRTARKADTKVESETKKAAEDDEKVTAELPKIAKTEATVAAKGGAKKKQTANEEEAKTSAEETKEEAKAENA